jgi:hypothetical protein
LRNGVVRPSPRVLDFRGPVVVESAARLNRLANSVFRDSALCGHSNFSRETQQAQGCPEHRKRNSAPGLVPVRRLKNGTPSAHPMGGGEIRALRRLKREQIESRRSAASGARISRARCAMPSCRPSGSNHFGEIEGRGAIARLNWR